MSLSLYIEGVVRIDLKNIQAITFSIVISVNINVLPEGGQRSVAIYVLIGLVVGAKRLRTVRLTIDIESHQTTVVISKVDFL